MWICQNSYPLKKISSGVVALVYNQVNLLPQDHPGSNVERPVISPNYKTTIISFVENVKCLSREMHIS